ncbi:hypothetical protein HYY75_13255 [bacterium]|nr:hypothetical protein [bacterium]
MEKISLLNEICLGRKTSKAVPAQILCRLLGNNKTPCPIDSFCSFSDRHGLGILYGSIAGIGTLSFVLFFWIFFVTRLSKIVGILWKVFSPPLKWLICTIIEIKKLWDC